MSVPFSASFHSPFLEDSRAQIFPTAGRGQGRSPISVKTILVQIMVWALSMGSMSRFIAQSRHETGRRMQVLVIGAGVVGLAVARAAARKGHEVIVAEAEAAIGTGTSSRNSEVIHGGMYYPTGSLRARHCVPGRRMLYEFCASHGVPHRKCGKLIVATNAAEIAKIESDRRARRGQRRRGPGADRRQRGARAGAGAGLRRRAAFAGDRHHRQPRLYAGAARRSRGRRRRHRLQDAGRAAARAKAGWVVTFGGSEGGSFGRRGGQLRRAWRATRRPLDRGLSAGARAAGWCSPREIISATPARPVFSRLIYPTPMPRRARRACDARSRRPHALRPRRRMDRGGKLRRRSGARRQFSTTASAPIGRRCRTGLIAADYAGIRPKLTGPSEPHADFLIDAPAQHGLPGLVQLFGIESPGLTSSLSLAEEVVGYLDS